MSSDSISILDGSTFIVSDRRGDIEAAPDQPQGLFYRDTRFLSRWVLTVNGAPLDVLSTDETAYSSAQFFLFPPTGTIYENPTLSVIRKRMVGDGFHEDVAVLNHAREPVDVELRLEAGSDFADLFEVKDALAKKGELYRSAQPDKLVLGYRRDRFVRETHVASSQPDVEISEKGLLFRLRLEPQSEWSTCLEVSVVIDKPIKIKYGHGEDHPKPNMRLSLEEWLERAPALDSDHDELGHVYRKSLTDLAALRFYSELYPEASLPAAGMPWFMTVFGRDSLITSYQALPFSPELARTSLLVLGARQGKRVDPFRDEEPGKILHEIRFGELTSFGERPHSPYFGTADATPLYPVLLDEYERWTGDADLVRELEAPARAALDWIDRYGDRDGDGYVEYERALESGLENQCWKDSWNSILFKDGSLAKLPRATCEIQGYVYDAKRRAARLARKFWHDEELAERLEREAAELRARFNEDFWMPEREFFAVALDGDKRQADSITSNPGHLLWSGIVDEDKAALVVRHLMDGSMFSGWGIRTMAVGEGAYNPIEYHCGTVWPHDNSIIAAGLARYGYREEAARVVSGILDAARYFEYRLPEAFAGYPRERTSFPVQYPTASSPQAWATGTPLLFLRTILGLEPSGDELVVDPWLPAGIERVELRGVPGRWGRADAMGARPVASVTSR
jgi:glycogen debranching enzyme